MIDAKILNSSASSNPALPSSISSSSSDTSGIDLAGLLIAQDDKGSGDATQLDPNTFALLLTQVLSQASMPVDNSIPAEKVATATSEGTNNLQEQLEAQNVATTWIDSKAFQALSNVSKEVVDAQVEPKLQSDASVENQLDDSTSGEQLASNDELLTSDTDIEQMAAELLAKGKQNPQQVVTDLPSQVAKDVVPMTQLKEDIDTLGGLALGASIKAQVKADDTRTDAVQLQNMTTLQNTAAAANTVKTLEIPVNLRNSEWANKFSEQIVWLGQQGINSASIKIHPQELGPLEINIKVVQDIASVNISSHSIAVRDIVDQAIPRLREMMAEQGLNLGDVHVGAESSAKQFSEKRPGDPDFIGDMAEEEIEVTPLNKKKPTGLVDYFA